MTKPNIIFSCLYLAGALCGPAKELDPTNSVIICSTTNRLNGVLSVLRASQREYLHTTNINGKLDSSYGSVVEVRDNHGKLLWNGCFGRSSPFSERETNCFLADLLIEDDGEQCYLALGIEHRFGLYPFSIRSDSVSLLDSNRPPLRINPRWVNKEHAEPLRPPFKEFSAELTWIFDLKLSRDGRFIVVTVNGQKKFRFSTWTGNWSVKMVSEDK